MTLYDHNGRPVSLASLGRVHADPARDPWLTPLREEVASQLSPERLGSLLRAADDGDPIAYLTLAEEIEERELHYSAVLRQRKAGVTAAQVAVEAASDQADHRRHADAVREITRKPCFDQLLFHMQDALGKGYSVVEQLWDTSGRLWWPRAYEWRDPTWFRLDPRTLEIVGLHDGTPEGTPLPPFKYVIHMPHLKSGAAVRGGLARPATIVYVLKRFTLQQMARFLEVYGIPVRLGRYPAQTPEGDKRELLVALRRIGSDAAAIIPDNVSVEFLDGQRGGRGGGAEGFIGAARFWDEQLSKLVLHQTMTTEAGASRSQSETHDHVRAGAALHDCRMSSGTINRDVTRPFIDINFGPQERYPRITISIIEADELSAWAGAVVSFVDRGLNVDQRHIRARLGLAEPEPDAVLLTPPPMGFHDPSGAKPTPGPEEDDEEEDDEGEPGDHAMHRRELVAELLGEALAEGGRWRELSAGSVERVLHAVAAAQSYDELRELLEQLELDTEDLEHVLAGVMTQARGAS